MPAIDGVGLSLGHHCCDSYFDEFNRHRMSENPTVTSEEIRRVMALMGKRGGSVKSAAKAEAARRNGKRGGRPKGKRLIESLSAAK